MDQNISWYGLTIKSKLNKVDGCVTDEDLSIIKAIECIQGTGQGKSPLLKDDNENMVTIRERKAALID